VANSITFKVKVEKDGNLKVVAKEAGAAAKSTDDLSRSTDRATKSRNRFHKAEKGVGQAGLSSAKGFSKMNQTMGGSSGLVAAYATLAANIFALTAAFGALSRAAQVEKLKDGLVAMGQATGVAMNSLSENLVRATGNAISLEEAMRTTAQVTSAGFDPSLIERLGKVARMASQALGRDLNDAMQRITRGAIKMEPELLDELGIMVRLDDATATYAAGLGKSADELTRFEKQQAFMNAVLEEGEKKFSALGDVDVNPYTQLAATFTNLTESFLNLINNALEPVVKLLASSQTMLVGALVLFASTAGKMVQPALGALIGKMGEMSGKSAKAAVDLVKLTGATGKGSKKVMELKEELAKGNVNTEKWKSGLNGSIRSMAGYRRSLDNNIKSQGLFSRATFSSLQSLRQSKKDHLGLVKAKLALDLANIRNSQSNAINTLQTNGLRAGIKQLTVDMGALYVASTSATVGLGRLATAMGVVAGAARAAGAALAFMGAGLLAALNWIGLAIMAGMLLFEAFKAISDALKSEEETKLQAAAENASTAFDDLKTNLTEVESALEGQSSKIKTVSDRYIALNNIMTTTVSEYNKLAKAQAELDASEGIGGNEINKDSEVLKSVQDLAKSSAVMSTALEEAGLNLADLEAGNVTLNQLNAAMKQVAENNNKTNTAMAGLAKEIEGLDEPMTKFLAKIKDTSDVDDIVSSFEELNGYIKNTDNAASTFDKLSVFAEKAGEDTLKLLGISKEQIKNAKGSVVMEEALLTTLEDKLETVGGIFETEKQQQITHKQRMSTLKAELTLLKQKEGLSGAAAATFDKEQEIANQTLTRMNQDITLKRLAAGIQEGAEHTNSKILDMEAERDAFVAALPGKLEKTLAIEKENVVILQRQQTARKALLDITSKMMSAQNKMLDLEEEQNKRNLQAANRADPNRGYSSELNAADRLKAAEGEAKVMLKINKDGTTTETKALNLLDRRKLAAENEYQMTLIKIELESAMNLAKLKVLDAEMRVIHAKEQQFLKEQAAKDPNKTFTPTAYEDSAIGQSIAAAMNISGPGGPAETLQKNLAKSVRDGVVNGITEGTEKTKEQRTAEILGATGATTGDRIETIQEAGGLDALEHTSQKIGAIRNSLEPMIEDMRKLGPEGELIAAVSSGALIMAESWTVAAEKFEAAGDGMGKMAAIGTAVAQTIQQVAAIMNAASQNRIAGIDKEIEAEKKRDGKSKQSLAKIASLEKKKEQEQRKAFERNKKLQMASVIASTAAGIGGVLAGIKDPLVTAPMAVMWAGIIAAMGAAQLAVIAGTSYQGGGGIQSPSAPTSVSLGNRRSSSDLSKSQSARGELAYFRGDQGIGGPENFRPAFSGRRNYATGGNMGYVVGEQGPELFMPERPGTIVPADDTAAAMGGNTNVTFSINAIDASGVEEVLAQQQGNIIGMIRTAANSYGEEFMEDLDETTYTAPVARRA
tara:strand:- start:5946 stop:10304 length:4359 start_codon:yes stop_codon:yes gene_type:complete